MIQSNPKVKNEFYCLNNRGIYCSKDFRSLGTSSVYPGLKNIIYNTLGHWQLGNEIAKITNIMWIVCLHKRLSIQQTSYFQFLGGIRRLGHWRGVM